MARLTPRAGIIICGLHDLAHSSTTPIAIKTYISNIISRPLVEQRSSVHSIEQQRKRTQIGAHYTCAHQLHQACSLPPYSSITIASPSLTKIIQP
ncbi:hypothetical protein SeMB42_g00781 [Synchytrium endobioticum]|uniref:Uncharacterized protein n=1 Tax=Synchytrium endobioticum TaxID=286115 RepID=A0A507DQB2_9FUNG|nr:hypothetical protein SeMB42_g00781 [Synchytrium endobioticum]